MSYGLRVTSYELRITAFLLSCFYVFVLFALPVRAEPVPDEWKGSLMGSLAPECAASGVCTLCDALQIFVVLMRWMLGFAGSIALLFFIYGGFLFLTSGGVESKVTSGKTALTNATIGLALILGSWMIVNTVIVLASGKEFSGKAAQIFSAQTWSTIECGPNK